MALPENRKAVLAILDEISLLIIGYKPRYFTSIEGDVATKIIPGGDLFPSDEVIVYSWLVEVPNVTTGNVYTTSLDAYIHYEELEKIFGRHFGPNCPRHNPYQLPTRGIDRVIAGYPVAVRIRDNSELTEFSFDWGCNQDAAKMIYELFGFSCGNMREPERIAKLIEVLRSINKPMIYAGGSTPQLPFESRWIDNYQSALETVIDEERVSLGIETHTERGATNIISSTITFYK